MRVRFIRAKLFGVHIRPMIFGNSQIKLAISGYLGSLLVGCYAFSFLGFCRLLNGGQKFDFSEWFASQPSYSEPGGAIAAAFMDYAVLEALMTLVNSSCRVRMVETSAGHLRRRRAPDLQRRLPACAAKPRPQPRLRSVGAREGEPEPSGVPEFAPLNLVWEIGSTPHMVVTRKETLAQTR